MFRNMQDMKEEIAQTKRQWKANSEVTLLDEYYFGKKEAVTQIEWVVSGSTGNIYRINGLPLPQTSANGEPAESLIQFACTCPDFQKRRVACKHIWFIVQKRLQNQTEWNHVLRKLNEQPSIEDRSLVH